MRKNPALWTQAIHDALPVIEWLYRNAFRNRDVSKPEDKKLIARDLLTEFRQIADPVERDAWMVRLSKDLGVSEDSLREALRLAKVSNVKPQIQPAHSMNDALRTTDYVPPKTRERELEERILAVCQLKPELRALAESILLDYPLPTIPIASNATPDENLSNYLAILADREFQDQSPDALRREIGQDSATLRALWLTETRTRLEQEMRDAERVGDADKIASLIAQFNTLVN